MHPPFDPRRSLAFLCAALLGALVAPRAGAQAPLPQISPGPFPVASWDWDFGMTTTTHPVTGQPLSVEHYGQLTYPTDGGGGALPPASPNGPFPLVVFGHGRFQTGPTLFFNHLQAAYLMDHLASWGYVCTSVNLDIVGQFSSPAAIPQRGDIFLSTIARTLDLANQPGTPPAGLQAAIDATRMALLGHSRGGEGAVSAAVKNLQLASPHPILAIGTIAPTDFETYVTPDVPYLGLYGSKDGDVNNGWPIMLHDRSPASAKLFEYIHGANHFWFTESITFSGEGDADIPRQLHHDIAKSYFGGFVVRTTETGETLSVLSDGPEMAPITSQVEILPMYRDPDRFVLDDFETGPSVNLSSEGTAVVASPELQVKLETSFDQSGFTFYHETRGFVGAFTNDADGLWAVQIVDGNGFDATPWSHLQMKFAQREEAQLNAAGLPQNVTVGLMDVDGDIGFVPLADHGKILFPETHGGGGPFANFPPKTVLQTSRIPLSAFQAANPALDLDALRFAGWVTDRTPQGELEFDDMELSQ